MINLARLLRLLPCLLISASGVLAQSNPDDNFRKQLVSAYEAGDAELATSLIEQQRLMVKPVVNGLISESISADLAGDATSAAKMREAATTIASAFKEVHGEKSLSEAVSYLDDWSSADQRAKLQADSLHQAATAQRSNAETRDEALKNYMLALATYRNIGDRIGAATTLGGIAFVYWFLGYADSTLAYLEAGLEARRAVDDRDLIGSSLNDMGLAARAIERDFNRATEYYSEAIRLRREIGDSTGLVRSLDGISAVYWKAGEPESALPFAQEAAALSILVSDVERQASTAYNAGSILMDLGRYSEALLALQNSLEFARLAQNNARTASVLTQMGATYRRLGDFEAAIDRYQEAIAISENLQADVTLAYALQSLGALFNYADRPAQAKQRFLDALALFEGGNDVFGHVRTLIGLSNVSLEMEDLAEAAAYAEDALRLSREAGQRAEVTRALTTLANAQIMLGKRNEAIENYQTALDEARAIGDAELAWTALMGIGEYHERGHDYDAAVTSYLNALEEVEGVRGVLQSQQDKAGYLAGKRFAYENILHLLSRLHGRKPNAGYDRRAFQIAERAKARSFLDILTEAVPAIEDRLDPHLRQRRDSLLSEIGRVQRALQTEAASAHADRTALAERQQQMNALEEEYHLLQRDIRRRNPAYSSLRYPEPSSVREVQAVLPENVVLLQYALGDSSSSLWAVTSKEIGFYTLPDRKVLGEKLEVIRFGLAKPDAQDRFETVARDLYRQLIHPAREFVEAGAHLVVIPDGVLHYLPFETLLTEDANNRDVAALPYLLRRHSVSYAPSASVLLQLKKVRNERAGGPEKQFVAFADPDFGDLEGAPLPVEAVRGGLERLPYSGDEANAIANLFIRGEADVYLRDAATEAVVKTPGLLEKYRYVHFASHGITDEQRPDFSAILLSQRDASNEDGFLQSAEIFNLRLTADLVVLSACETGLGKMVRGEGLIGLTRAFMYAGAPTLVVSLWSVADRSTSVLMESFYESLVRDGLPTVEALREAKLRVLSDFPEYVHPFHWAPFIIVGDGFN